VHLTLERPAARRHLGTAILEIDDCYEEEDGAEHDGRRWTDPSPR
jgi:hypothetical protein